MYQNINRISLNIAKLLAAFLLIIMILFLNLAKTEDLTFGNKLLEEKKYEKAMKYFWSKVSEGNAYAMTRYAQSKRGLLNNYDIDIALSGVMVYPYYLLAANAGEPEAQKMVCFIAIPLSEEDRSNASRASMTKALSYCVLSAKNGNTTAKDNLKSYEEDFPPEYFKQAEKIADSFKIIPFPSFGNAPPPSWIEFTFN